MKKLVRGNVVVIAMYKGKGSEQHGVRLAVIVSNDDSNNHSPVLNIIPFTTKVKSHIPSHLLLRAEENQFLCSDSIVMCEQIDSIDKSRVISVIGSLNKKTMQNIGSKMRMQLGIE